MHPRGADRRPTLRQYGQLRAAVDDLRASIATASQTHGEPLPSLVEAIDALPATTKTKKLAHEARELIVRALARWRLTLEDLDTWDAARVAELRALVGPR